MPASLEPLPGTSATPAGDLVEVRLNDEITAWEGTGNLEGHYANCFRVGYNAFELVIDFGQIAGEASHAWLTGRILTNPRAAKALCDILRQTLEEYERIFGVIQDKEG